MNLQKKGNSRGVGGGTKYLLWGKDMDYLEPHIRLHVYTVCISSLQAETRVDLEHFDFQGQIKASLLNTSKKNNEKSLVCNFFKLRFRKTFFFSLFLFRVGAVARENFHQDTFPNLLHRYSGVYSLSYTCMYANQFGVIYCHPCLCQPFSCFTVTFLHHLWSNIEIRPWIEPEFWSSNTCQKFNIWSCHQDKSYLQTLVLWLTGISSDRSSNKLALYSNECSPCMKQFFFFVCVCKGTLILLMISQRLSFHGKKVNELSNCIKKNR